MVVVTYQKRQVHTVVGVAGQGLISGFNISTLRPHGPQLYCITINFGKQAGARGIQGPQESAMCHCFISKCTHS